MTSSDTIVAISTPHGSGGIAVARVSGGNVISCVAKCWRGAPLTSMASHSAHLGTVVNSRGELLDEVVLTLFRGPRSFTGEDVVEISCHGSLWIQQQLINTLVDCGCRAAAAGEFTRRAFTNGRIDLSQAEAIADVIAAQSATAHRVAMNQMRGAFAKHLASLREKLLEFTSLVELELDFSEEDVEFADRSRLIALAADIHSYITRLADSYREGNAIRNGIPVAIIGATNAGKSTLLNAIVGDDRAIVSDIHGTTRDVIEDSLVLNGVQLRLIDTAGIRRSNDAIETLGIERSFQKLREASIVVWVIDATAAQADVDRFYTTVAPAFEGKKVLAVLNKCDLLQGEPQLKLAPSLDTIAISAHNSPDIDRLKQRLTALADLPEVDDNTLIVINARHYEALTRAADAIARVNQALDDGLPGDLLSQDLRECLHFLGEITGEITSANVLQSIFSRFCIGK